MLASGGTGSALPSLRLIFNIIWRLTDVFCQFMAEQQWDIALERSRVAGGSLKSPCLPTPVPGSGHVTPAH